MHEPRPILDRMDLVVGDVRVIGCTVPSRDEVDRVFADLTATVSERSGRAPTGARVREVVVEDPACKAVGLTSRSDPTAAGESPRSSPARHERSKRPGCCAERVLDRLFVVSDHRAVDQHVTHPDGLVGDQTFTVGGEVPNPA